MGELTVRITRDIDVPMRDGCGLKTDVYVPGDGRHPVLLLRIPYNKELAQSYVYGHPIWYARQGFAVVVQDTRGRYLSEGEFYPLRHEADDAFDAVTWVRSQDFAIPDKVGLYGFSYPGKSQMLLAARYPGAITAMAPGFCGNGMYDTTHTNRAFNLAMVVSWSIQLAADEARFRGNEEQFRSLTSALGCIHKLYSTLPLEELLPLRESGRSAFFFDMLQHPERGDQYWQPMEVGESGFSQIVTPALHFGGWYDSFINETLTNFERLSHRSDQFLVVGPWYHIPWSPQVGQLDFGPGARNFIDEAQLQWFTYWLNGETTKSKPIEMPRVRLFVMGRNQWREEEQFPLTRAETRKFYLRSQGKANSSSGDGTLSTEPPEDEDEDIFVYNPLDPVPSLGGNSCCFEDLSPMGAYDQRPVEVRNDVLVYSTEPLDVGLEVTGRVSVELYVDFTAPTTDFTAKLVDVFPDGRAINLCQSVMRVEKSRDKSPQLITFGIGATSNFFDRAHRIRLEVSSSNFPMYERNLNTIKPSGPLSAQLSTQRVFHRSSNPSLLLLPVIEAGSR